MDSYEANVERLRQAFEAVEAFDARNWAQRHVQGVLVAVFSHLTAECLEAGEELEFERWWVAVEAYREVLECPRLLEPGGRALMEEALSLPWKRLEKPGVMRRLLKRGAKSQQKRSRSRRGKGRRGRARRLGGGCA